MPTPVLIPLVNTNEPEAVLVSLSVMTGQLVQPGDLLCTLETTKSTAEVTAPGGGYIVALHLQPGEMVHAGELLCYLAESPDWLPEPAVTAPGTEEPQFQAPEGLRISQPALALARQRGLDLNRLPADRFITEEIVLRMLQASEASQNVPVSSDALIIYGGGGHGKSLIELVRLAGKYQLVGVVDDGLLPGDTILDLPVLGGGEILTSLVAKGIRLAVNAVGGIGKLETRINVFDRLRQAGFTCPAVVHPTAFIESSAKIAEGVQVFPHAYVGSETSLGYGCIINTGAVVSHDCRLADYVNISPGALLAGEVVVGRSVLIGMGATINLRAKIGAQARIGNSAVVKSDVPENTIVRAGTIWPV